jgi:hypothetical protein
MAKQTISLGTLADGSDGDTNRTAWGKANGNFDEIYADGYVGTARIADGAVTTAKLGAVPAAKAASSATQSLANATWQKVLLANEIFDTGFYDPTTSRFTPTVAGKYLCIGAVSIAGMSSGQRAGAAVVMNGTVVENEAVAASSAASSTVQHSTIYAMNGSTDYIELYARQDSGSAKNISNSADTVLSVVWLGP